MKRRHILTLCILMVLVMGLSNAIAVCGQPYSLAISVPNDYGTIQEAINHASPRSTVFVSSGLYYERIIVNKTITLVGENRESTILDGGSLGTVVRVTADDVKITGLKLQNTGWKWGRAGVEVDNADNCVIEDNFVYLTCHQIRLVSSQGSRVISNIISAPSYPFPQSAYGIRLENCTNSLVIKNTISNNIGGIHFEKSANCTATGNYVFQNDQGIRLYSPCVNNKIFGNTILNNTYDGMIEALPSNMTFAQNLFFHNNFINNSQPFIYKTTGCVWDNGFEGNYWTKYEGEDTNHDGIGDTPYNIGQEEDRYPLIGKHCEYRVIRHESVFNIWLVCNSEILDFLYEDTNKYNTPAITLNMGTHAGEPGFCRITIPVGLLAKPYTIRADDSLVPNATLKELPGSNSTHSILHFTYGTVASTITILGKEGITDNPLIPLHFVLATTFATALIMIAVIVLRKGRAKNAKQSLH